MLSILRMLAVVRSLRCDERGLTGVEYAIMLVFLSIVIAAGAFVLGGDVSGLFNDVGGSLEAASLPGLP